MLRVPTGRLLRSLAAVLLLLSLVLLADYQFPVSSRRSQRLDPVEALLLDAVERTDLFVSASTLVIRPNRADWQIADLGPSANQTLLKALAGVAPPPHSLPSVGDEIYRVHAAISLALIGDPGVLPHLRRAAAAGAGQSDDFLILAARANIQSIINFMEPRTADPVVARQLLGQIDSFAAGTDPKAAADLCTRLWSTGTLSDYSKAVDIVTDKFCRGTFSRQLALYILQRLGDRATPRLRSLFRRPTSPCGSDLTALILDAVPDKAEFPPYPKKG